jgi:quinolinate synthase
MIIEEYQRLSSDQLRSIVEKMKKEREAVFLVHNYQRLEVQRLADHIGDSLALAQAAVRSRARLIVFCGVHFMAETAKLLNPDSKVIMPDPGAGCPMADMVTPEALRTARAGYGDPMVVAYVNTSAAVKAESDICCTSSNAVRVVQSVPRQRRILFVPDRNLGAYAAKTTGRDVILWPGHCFVHDRITVDDVRAARREHPEARLIVHPECRPQVVELADEVASTSGMVQAVREHPEIDQWIIGTENGLVEQLAAAHPGKGIYPLSPDAVCNNMKLTTLAKAAWALEHEAGEVTVPLRVAERARLALERMLALG